MADAPGSPTRTIPVILNEVKDLLAEDPAYRYDYDSNGNLIKRTSKTDSTTYRLYYYDWDQKLVQIKDYVSSSLSKTVDYTYDPLGNLIKRVEDGTSTTTYVQAEPVTVPSEAAVDCHRFRGRTEHKFPQD